MTQFIILHDLVCSSDPQGRTYKQINLATPHAIPVGSFVELWNGSRAWVVHHHRDCDGTPFYAVSLKREDVEEKRRGFANPGWRHGLPEDCLALLPNPPEVED